MLSPELTIWGPRRLTAPSPDHLHIYCGRSHVDGLSGMVSMVGRFYLLPRQGLSKIGTLVDQCPVPYRRHGVYSSSVSMACSW